MRIKTPFSFIVGRFKQIILIILHCIKKKKRKKIILEIVNGSDFQNNFL